MLKKSWEVEKSGKKKKGRKQEKAENVKISKKGEIAKHCIKRKLWGIILKIRGWKEVVHESKHMFRRRLMGIVQLSCQCWK